MNLIAATITTLIVLGIIGFIVLGYHHPPVIVMVILTVASALTLAAVWGLIYGLVCTWFGE